jgi:hypothetical protein
VRRLSEAPRRVRDAPHGVTRGRDAPHGKPVVEVPREFFYFFNSTMVAPPPPCSGGARENFST